MPSSARDEEQATQRLLEQAEAVSVLQSQPDTHCLCTALDSLLLALVDYCCPCKPTDFC